VCFIETYKSYTKFYHSEEDNDLRSAIEILKHWDAHSKADVYGLGISLAEMLLYVDPTYGSEEDTKGIDALKALATNMLLCHPKQRASITLVIERLETLKS
jgi:hypothetical protein